MSNTTVQVTFSAPLIFLSSDQWTQIRTAISDQFPLRESVWRSSFRPAVRTIPELAVELVGLETIRDELNSQVPHTLLDKPFLNLYIVTCDVRATLITNMEVEAGYVNRTPTCIRTPFVNRSRIGTLP